MRLCFILLPIEFYSPVSGGAIATVTKNVVRELETDGHEVSVIAPEDAQPVYEQGAVSVVRVKSEGLIKKVYSHLEARMNRWDHLGEGSYWEGVTGVLRRVRPDVVVLANDLLAVNRVRAVLPKTKIIVWLHNECEPRGDVQKAIGSADAFLTCSDYIRSWFLNRYKVESGRVLTAHAGVDRSEFYPGEKKAGKPVRMLYVGRLDPNKGVDRAVNGVRLLREAGLDVSLTVAGSTWFYQRRNPSEDSFLTELKGEMNQAGVDWLGHVPRRWLPMVMREHDVALVLSRSNEPFGLVVLEAMASGLAVVASSHGGLSEACGGAGLLMDSYNQQELVKQLEGLCRDETKLQNLRERSIQRAASANWSNTASVLLLGIESLGRAPIFV